MNSKIILIILIFVISGCSEKIPDTKLDLDESLRMKAEVIGSIKLGKGISVGRVGTVFYNNGSKDMLIITECPPMSIEKIKDDIYITDVDSEIDEYSKIFINDCAVEIINKVYKVKEKEIKNAESWQET